MKYVIHNVKDSSWNIMGNQYFVIVTDPAISKTMTAADCKVRESVSDPMQKDFIAKIHFEAKQVTEEKFMDKKDFLHKECISKMLEWIKDDIFLRGSEEFEIKTRIDL